MNLESTAIAYLDAESLKPLTKTPEEFLEKLKKPSWILLKGKDRTRCRVLTTLLHGNEPSGFIALHRYLSEGMIPETDIHCLVASVPAALKEPLFSTRMLPGHRDLNRCFKPPYNDEAGQIAKEILAHINILKPEAVIDIHNTSGDGPSFGVSTLNNPAHISLTELFTHRLVITNIRLGALMEIATDDFRVITVEVGGRQEPSSHETAYQGICRYMSAVNLYDTNFKSEVIEVLQHPVRLEIRDNKTLCYASEQQAEADVTITSEIEKYNFGEIPANQNLGWLGKSGLEALSVKGTNNQELINDYFKASGNNLQTRLPMKLFMATPDPKLATGDCLFYLVAMDNCF